MQIPVEIDDRKKKILKAIVQNYILTGKPVGSKAIAQSCALGVSPATIRNEMAMLEDLGLLLQPYTSAGRVPTDLAYRYYVDILMGQPKPSREDMEAVKKLFAARSREMESLFQEASILLSGLTHTTAMVFAPFKTGNVVRHIDVLRITPKRVLVIVITESGAVGRRIINLREEAAFEEVEKVSRFLDLEVSRKCLEEIDVERILTGARFKESSMSIIRSALNEIRSYLGSIEERVFVGGKVNILREFENAGKEWIQVLLEAMERQYFILDLLKDIIKERQLTVRIGEENKPKELQKCAFVGTSYPVGDEGLFGSLGVVGPTSMDYARTIGAVEYMAGILSRLLNRKYS